MHITLDGQSPVVHETAWTAPGVVLVADVELGEEVSVWYGAVLRADCDAIRIGARSNLQDNVVVHTDAGFPVHVGTGVSVGHGAVLHGCTVEDDVLVGMGATILNGARIGAGSLIAAGALVPENADISPGSLVAGVPGKVRRELREEEVEHIRANGRMYLDLARRHSAATAAAGDAR